MAQFFLLKQDTPLMLFNVLNKLFNSRLPLDEPVEQVDLRISDKSHSVCFSRNSLHDPMLDGIKRTT